MTDNTKGLSEDPDQVSGAVDDDQVEESATQIESDEGGPAGDELADELTDPEPFEVVDDDAEELDVDPSDADQQDDTPDKGDPEDVVIADPEELDEATARVRSARPVRKGADQDEAPAKAAKSATKASGAGATTAKKATKTRRQSDAVAARVVHKRTTPPMFVNQSVGELKKVNWPTGDQLRQYFIVVLVFVLFIIAYVGLLDFGFGWGLLKLLGSK